ncbi:fungal-specific transcription factor domain-containing protein [Dendryphion nanum]|uniref:Fungal-specific transcription factor domain-containing protein n=1 Tax=Dendryphion nanum TaxID=256645 RepID=A0A9P9EDV6_9PLEO|nr:fungal-specific transcription factor domain-containing protein [Dendryphion nanum]
MSSFSAIMNQVELVPNDTEDHPRSTASRSPATPRSPLVDPSRKRSLAPSVDPTDHRPKRKVTRACDTCKSKKAKCSGTQPCESCAKRGLACLYEARYLRGKPPTPPQSDQTRPPGSHFQPINGRQSDLTNVHVPHPHTILSPRPIQQSPTRESVGFTMASQVLQPEEQVERTSIIHPIRNTAHQSDIPASRNSPELEVAGQYSDSTSGLSFLHRAWRRLSNNQNSQVMSGALGSSDDNQLLMHAGDNPFHDSGRLHIPNIVRAQSLLILYFDVCIATYRLLHRPTVEEWLRRVVDNSERHQPLWTGVTRPRASIVLTVLAVATFHEEKAKSTPTGFSPVNAESSLRECDAIFCEASRLTENETGFPKIESAQARLIQVLYLLMSSRMNQAWYTFGHALQIISALGLHRREDRKRASQKRDYIEEQCRKRTFWVAYTLDKYMGVIFGRPRHYHDDDIDQDFPDSVNDESMSSNGPIEGADDTDCHIESLVFHARLAQIAEKISREVYSIKVVPDHERIAASHRLGRELRNWKADLPPFLGTINPSSLISSYRRQSTALKLAYSHAVMLAHRPFLLKNMSNRQEIRDMAQDSINECISAAKSVLESVDRMARDGRLFHAFWWTHYVCFCALSVVYVWAIQQSDNGRAEDGSYVKIFDLAERCLNHLAQATASNSPSRRYSIILQELRTEAKRKTARRSNDHVPLTSGSTQRAEAPSIPPNTSLLSQQSIWEPMFGSPIDTAVPGLSNFLDNWQTTDWLDLDSSAFVGFDNMPMG